MTGRLVIMGIGNILKADDGFGPALIERLRGRIKAECIDAGTTPENYAGKIAKLRPDTVLIVDAVHLDRAPGDYDILEQEDILRSGFTTHDMSPDMFMEYLQRESGSQIYMLGVQPKDISLGGEMSTEIRQTLDLISESILQRLKE